MTSPTPYPTTFYRVDCWFGADEFPAAFLRWADADIRDAAAEQAEADRAADKRRYVRGEAA